eukprot:2038740-Heterocapsa_arctica.AAC.1
MPFAPDYYGDYDGTYYGGGKNKGKGKGKRSGNPRGQDGQPMKCHNCGSDQHLIRECDRPKTQQQSLLATGTPSAMVPMPARGSSYGGYSFFHSDAADPSDIRNYYPLDQQIWGEQQQASTRPRPTVNSGYDASDE